MTAGVGPVLSYAQQFGKTGSVAEVNWLPQIDTQKTLKGDYVWFKIGRAVLRANLKTCC
jgi:hypothetical protein